MPAPTTYNLRTDADPVIPAGWPGSPHALETPAAAGASVVDPNFNTRVTRLSDATMDPGGSHVELTAGPNNNMISSNDRHVLGRCNTDWIVFNFDPDTGTSSGIHSRFASGKDPGFARAPSKAGVIYFTKFNGILRFDQRVIATAAETTLFNIETSGEHAAGAIVDGDYGTEIYSSQAENPEVLVMAYGGSEVMLIGDPGTANKRVAVTSRNPGSVAGRSVTVQIAATANQPLSASDFLGDLLVTLGTDGTGGVASTTKNTAALIRNAINLLPDWFAKLPYIQDTTGALPITTAMATTDLSGSGQGIQENWIYLTWINANNPAERGTLDIMRGQVKLNGGAWTQILTHTGAAWSLPGQSVHSLSIDRSGTIIDIDPHGSSSHRILWNRATNRIHDITNNMWLGHYAMGWMTMVNCTEDGGQFPQWLHHDLAQGGTFPTYRKLIDPGFTGLYLAHGEHSSWNNAESNVLTPIITGTGYAASLYPWATYRDNMKPLIGEIAAIATAAGAIRGVNQFWRACSSQMQAYDTGLAGDTNTYAANRYHFWMNQFVQVTHDGRYAFFNTNWNYRLGTYGLLSHHTGGMPAGLPDYRRDIFFVEMRRLDSEPEPEPPPPPVVRRTRSGMGYLRQRRRGGGYGRWRH